MKNNFLLNEMVIATILIVLVLLFLNPFDLLMPPPILSMLNLFLIAVFGIFAAIIWKEKPRDEREGLHRMIAGRFAFLIGSGILVLGIMMQSIDNAVDPWLVYALVGMILAKIFGLLYGQRRY